MERYMTLLVMECNLCGEFGTKQINVEYCVPMVIGEIYIFGLQAHLPNFDYFVSLKCPVIITRSDLLEN